MLEAYQAYGAQTTIAMPLRDICLGLADALGSRVVQTPRGEVDLAGPWRWLPVYDAVSEAVGEQVTPETPVQPLRRYAAARDVALDPDWGADKVVLQLLSELVEPTLGSPTFLCDYPAIAQPLARPHRHTPGLIEAWDLIIAGVERGTGFSELIDPILQRDVLHAQSLLAAGGDPEAMQLDEDFLRALEFGAPPMGGLGMGLDRMVMFFSGSSIRETILFPLLKPED